jgi:hypothetical protein
MPPALTQASACGQLPDRRFLALIGLVLIVAGFRFLVSA